MIPSSNNSQRQSTASSMNTNFFRHASNIFTFRYSILGMFHWKRPSAETSTTFLEFRDLPPHMRQQMLFENVLFSERLEAVLAGIRPLVLVGQMMLTQLQISLEPKSTLLASVEDVRAFVGDYHMGFEVCLLGEGLVAFVAQEQLSLRPMFPLEMPLELVSEDESIEANWTSWGTGFDVWHGNC